MSRRSRQPHPLGEGSPTTDIATRLLQAELRETHKALALAVHKLQAVEAAAAQATDHAQLASECLAIMLHRTGETGTELTEIEKRAAWDATWLRLRLDILEHDDVGASVRLTLLPVTLEEREANEAKKGPQGPKIILQ